MTKNQEALLAALKDWKSWHCNCQWIWGSTEETERNLRALVRQGKVTVKEEVISRARKQEIKAKVYRPK